MPNFVPEAIEDEELNRSFLHHHQQKAQLYKGSGMYDEARRHDHHHGVLRGDSQDPSDMELLKAEAHAIAQAQAHEVSASKKDHSSSARSGVGSSTSRKRIRQEGLL